MNGGGSLSLSLNLNKLGEPGWLSRLSPTSAQVIISRFMSLGPTSGSVLIAQILEPAVDSVSPSLSAPP